MFPLFLGENPSTARLLTTATILALLFTVTLLLRRGHATDDSKKKSLQISTTISFGVTLLAALTAGLAYAKLTEVTDTYNLIGLAACLVIMGNAVVLTFMTALRLPGSRKWRFVMTFLTEILFFLALASLTAMRAIYTPQGSNTTWNIYLLGVWVASYLGLVFAIVGGVVLLSWGITKLWDMFQDWRANRAAGTP